jgi:hypothetical protein
MELLRLEGSIGPYVLASGARGKELPCHRHAPISTRTD